MTDDELAEFLTKVAAIYNDRRYLPLSTQAIAEAVDNLSAPGLLSISAIAAITELPEGRVRRAWPIGRPHPRKRGKLNPTHIAMLGYVLSQRRTNTMLVGLMLANGTSLSTISDLTNVSEATLYRWRNNLA